MKVETGRGKKNDRERKPERKVRRQEEKREGIIGASGNRDSALPLLSVISGAEG